MEQIIQEGKAKIYAELRKVVSADMEVFYNPVMQVNRDFTILILSSIENKNMKIADPLAGSGIRTLRILNELNEEKIKNIFVNDKKYKFKEYFEKNIELNKLSDEEKEKIIIFNEDANIFLLKNKVFDYIDIDPFGTPNPFLDAAVQSLRNKGIIAVTATDTSSLCGSYVSACKRKYFSTPLRNEWMHEFGIRILIRKVQLIGAQFDKALIPVFCYAKEHYMKIFFLCTTGKTKVDEILKKHESVDVEGKTYGPIWAGKLWDEEIVEKMMKESEREEISKETKKLLLQINEEKNIPSLFFQDVHKLSEKLKSGDTPRFENIMENLKKKGFKASRTHFSLTGIRTDASESDFRKVFENLLK